MSKLKIIKAKGFANEPAPTKILNKSHLISVINWYRNNELITLDDLKGYLVAYGKIKLSNINIDLIKINYYTPYLVLARLYLIGWNIPDNLFKEQKLLDYIQTCKKVTKVEIIEDSSAEAEGETTGAEDGSDSSNEGSPETEAEGSSIMETFAFD